MVDRAPVNPSSSGDAMLFRAFLPGLVVGIIIGSFMGLYVGARGGAVRLPETPQSAAAAPTPEQREIERQLEPEHAAANQPAENPQGAAPEQPTETPAAPTNPENSGEPAPAQPPSGEPAKPQG
ncbi:MAG: hypothetical protein SFZ24_05790 [Planctomycetota bacterium]|nr:hypothetical protein [Planctomycetota bacterium]